MQICAEHVKTIDRGQKNNNKKQKKPQQLFWKLFFIFSSQCRRTGTDMRDLNQKNSFLVL